jgi:hypothetical protein
LTACALCAGFGLIQNGKQQTGQNRQCSDYN